MVHVDGNIAHPILRDAQLKQVEFNTYSCAGATHANIVADIHQHLHKTGAYSSHFGDPAKRPSSIPRNAAIEGLVRGLVSAHNTYGPPKAAGGRRTGILITMPLQSQHID